MQVQTKDRRAKWQKLGVSLLVGGVVGFAGASAMLASVDSGALGELDLSQVGALCVALMYLLMGVAVGVGVAAPRLGSTFLNVEDADELREERATLMPSAVSCIALAAGLAALAVSGASGTIAREVALALFAGSLALATWLSIAIVRRSDELMREVMRAGAAASFYLAFAVMGGWAMLAHLGFVAPPAMLDIVTMFFGLTLLGCFWVIGRRGMLMPR